MCNVRQTSPYGITVRLPHVSVHSRRLARWPVPPKILKWNARRFLADEEISEPNP